MKNFTVEIAELLNEYNEDVKEVVKEAAKEAATRTATLLKSTSPKGNRGRYAKGWAVKQEGNSFIVHNKTDYQLAHLLENGHVVKNQFGTYGRTRAIKHIEPAEQEGIREFENLIRSKLGRG